MSGSRGEKMRNIGTKSSAWLRQVGIHSLDDLRTLGAVGSFLKVKRAGFRPSLNLLYAIEGALHDCHWQEISAERRSELLLEVDAAEDVAVNAARSAGPVRDVTARTASLYEDEDGFDPRGDD